MSILTVSAARAAAPGRGVTLSLAEAELRKTTRAPLTTAYDIFLSHSTLDADVVAGVKVLLEREGLKVYVYWAEDGRPQSVTRATAETLRLRMRKCKSLIYAASDSSPNSKWMPWELGYFDGYSPGHVAILPLVQASGQSFRGQEYLQLYPHLEQFLIDGRLRLGLPLPSNLKRTLPNFVRVGA
jgi:hypothetical protein